MTNKNIINLINSEANICEMKECDYTPRFKSPASVYQKDNLAVIEILLPGNLNIGNFGIDFNFEQGGYKKCFNTSYDKAVKYLKRKGYAMKDKVCFKVMLNIGMISGQYFEMWEV